MTCYQSYTERLYGVHKHDRLFPYTKSFFEHEMMRRTKGGKVKRIRLHDIRHPYVKPKTKKYESFLCPVGQRKTALQLNNLGLKTHASFPISAVTKKSCVAYSISILFPGKTYTFLINRSASDFVRLSLLSISCMISSRFTLAS